MNQRKVLASCGLTASALSGCLSTLPVGNESPEKRTVSMGSVEQDLPDGLRVFVTLTDQRITPESTVTIEIGLKNAGTEPVTVVGGNQFPFTGTYGEDRKWMLLATGRRKTASNCWEPPSNDTLGTSDIAYEKTVSPGEEYAREYQLWGSPMDDVCMPTEEFRFSRSYGTSDSDKPAEWEFSVSVTTPEDPD